MHKNVLRVSIRQYDCLPSFLLLFIPNLSAPMLKKECLLYPFVRRIRWLVPTHFLSTFRFYNWNVNGTGWLA